jgi:hypothetical protein
MLCLLVGDWTAVQMQPRLHKVCQIGTFVDMLLVYCS